MNLRREDLLLFAEPVVGPHQAVEHLLGEVTQVVLEVVHVRGQLAQVQQTEPGTKKAGVQLQQRSIVFHQL